MGIIDDYYGGYENLCMHMDDDGGIDYDGAYEAANFGGYDAYGGAYSDDDGYSEGEMVTVRFKRPDGRIECKTIGWCRSNGAEEIDDDLWAMPGHDYDAEHSGDNDKEETGIVYEPKHMATAELAKEREIALVAPRQELWKDDSGWFTLTADAFVRIGRRNSSFPHVKRVVCETGDSVDASCVHTAFPELESLCVTPGMHNGGITEGNDYSALDRLTRLTHFELRIHGSDSYDDPVEVLHTLGKLNHLQHVHISGVRSGLAHGWKALESLPPTLQTLSFHSANEQHTQTAEEERLLDKVSPIGAAEKWAFDKYGLRRPVRVTPGSELARRCTVDLSHLVALSAAHFVGGDFCSLEELFAGAAFDGQALVLPTSLRELTLGLSVCIPGIACHSDCERLGERIRERDERAEVDEEWVAASSRLNQEFTAAQGCPGPSSMKHPDYYGDGGGGCTLALGAALERLNLQRLECKRAGSLRTYEEALVEYEKEMTRFEQFETEQLERERQQEKKRKAEAERKAQQQAQRQAKRARDLDLSMPDHGNKHVKAQGSSSGAQSSGSYVGSVGYNGASSIPAYSGSVSDRTCEVCNKVLKTIAGKAQHKRDVHK